MPSSSPLLPTPPSRCLPAEHGPPLSARTPYSTPDPALSRHSHALAAYVTPQDNGRYFARALAAVTESFQLEREYLTRQLHQLTEMVAALKQEQMVLRAQLELMRRENPDESGVARKKTSDSASKAKPLPKLTPILRPVSLKAKPRLTPMPNRPLLRPPTRRLSGSHPVRSLFSRKRPLLPLPH